jgi:hypothetical protein
MLTCLNPWAIHLYSLACLLWYFSLAEYDMCSHLFIYCIYTTRIAARTWRLLLSTRRSCHQSAACGVPFWRSAASCSLCCCVVETLGHVMVLILSFTLWHCIWYSRSHYVCVTWSWRTCNLCIRVYLQIRVWQLWRSTAAGRARPYPPLLPWRDAAPGDGDGWGAGGGGLVLQLGEAYLVIFFTFFWNIWPASILVHDKFLMHCETVSRASRRTAKTLSCMSRKSTWQSSKLCRAAFVVRFRALS